MSPDQPIPDRTLHDCVILIVDDEHANVRLLERILGRAGFARVHSTTDPAQAVSLHEQVASDLLLLDIHMPVMDGFAVLASLRERVPPTEYLPILAITGDDSPDTRQRALTGGAKDFLGKPFQPSEVVVRVENLLTTRMLHRSLRHQNEQLEATVKERTTELELALHAARGASRAKSQFLATMSHELRTPLNAVIGFSQQLLRNRAGNLQPQDLGFLERIRDNGQQLLSIFTDILELAQIETGSVQIEPRELQLEPLLQSVADEVRPALAPGVALHVRVPADAMPVNADEAKLRRVLRSLAGNAAKFTPRGHVTLGASTARDGRPLRIDVVDTGVGIAPERLGVIFDLFEQADNTLQRQFGGTGLGLAISRTLCDLLGYRLAAVSDPGAGSAFSVLLEAIAPPLRSYVEAAAAYGAAPAARG